MNMSTWLEVKGQAAGNFEVPKTLIFNDGHNNYYVGKLLREIRNTAIYKTPFYAVTVSFKEHTAKPSSTVQIATGIKAKCGRYNRWTCYITDNPEEAVATRIAEQENIRAIRKAMDDAQEAEKAAKIQAACDKLMPLWDAAVASWKDESGFEYRVLEVRNVRVDTVIIGLGKEEDTNWSTTRWTSFVAYRERRHTSLTTISTNYEDSLEEALAAALYNVESWTT